MDCYYFTEMPYPHIPPHDQVDSFRVTLPNRMFDPKLGHQLYNRYLDEYCLADELGPEDLRDPRRKRAQRLAIMRLQVGGAPALVRRHEPVRHGASASLPVPA